MRLFLAIDLPGDVRESLATIARPPLNALKWVGIEQLHVTLKFLGEIPDADVPRLIEQLEAMPKLPPMDLEIDGLTLFPEHGQIRIVAAHVEDASGDLARLAAELEAVGEDFGVEREGRTFQAHVTLARANPSVRRDRVILHVPEMPFRAMDFVLMRSRLSPAGSMYETIARFPFGSRPNSR